MSPRIPISTIYTRRTKPSTTYTKPRDREESPVSFDSVDWTFDSTEITFDMIFRDLGPIISVYNRPRKDKYVQDWLGINVLDLSGEQVLGISGNEVNKINTIYR